MNNLDANNQPTQDVRLDAVNPQMNLDVRNQPSLSAKRTFEIAWNGMRYRLFRSVLTLMVIAVAIAFLMNVVCEAISMRSVSHAAQEKTMTSRLAALWSARLTMVGTSEDVLRELADTTPTSNLRLGEDRQFAQLPVGADAALRRDASQAVGYMDFFAQLPFATRRALVHHATGTAIFDQLQPHEARATFLAQLTQYHVRAPEGLNAFLDIWGASLKQQVALICAGHAQAIARLAPALAGRTMQEALPEADQAFGQQVQDAGFSAFNSKTRHIVASEAQQSSDIARLQDSILIPKMRKDLSGYMNVSTGDINLTFLWATLQDKQVAGWYLGKLASLREDFFKQAPEKQITDPAAWYFSKWGTTTSGPSSAVLTADRVVALANEKSESASLEDALNLTAESQGGFMGMGTRMTWLVLISLLVCVVGISNAMLMSVTERFREIATLKCLGALDGFIMMLFLIEAGLLGLVGGVIGSLLGSLIGFGRMMLTFSTGLLFASFPVALWAEGLLLAIVVGVLLAALAGVYPSYMAARLAPMEAMRIE